MNKLLLYVTLTIILTLSMAESTAPLINITNWNATNGLKLRNDGVYGFFGYSVSNAGDFNNDGIADVIIGAYQANSLNRTSNGVVYVLFGSKSEFPNFTVDLENLTEAQGFRINGALNGDRLGNSVSSAGDFNGDGINDIILGAYNPTLWGGTGYGVTYVLFGRNGNISDIDLNNYLSPALGTKIIGSSSGDSFGASVSGIGDVNGDNIDDVIIGAYNPNMGHNSPNTVAALGPPIGSAYVIYGSKSIPSTIDLSSSNLTATQGFQIIDSNKNEIYGYAVNGVRDINGDGVQDIIIGAYRTSPSGRDNLRVAYIIYGRKNGFSDITSIDINNLSNEEGFQIIGANQNAENEMTFQYWDYWGNSVNAAGDVNGDGIGDIIIGAYEASPLGRSMAGVAYVIFGKRGGLPNIDLRDNFTNAQGFQIIGAMQDDTLGIAVSPAGDVNADGIDDVIVGAYNKPNTDTGKAYIIFGSNNSSSDIDLNEISGTQGIRFTDTGIKNWFGISASGAGDFNGDGVDDVIISQPCPESVYLWLSNYTAAKPIQGSEPVPVPKPKFTIGKYAFLLIPLVIIIWLGIRKYQNKMNLSKRRPLLNREHIDFSGEGSTDRSIKYRFYQDPMEAKDPIINN